MRSEKALPAGSEQNPELKMAGQLRAQQSHTLQRVAEFCNAVIGHMSRQLTESQTLGEQQLRHRVRGAHVTTVEAAIAFRHVGIVCKHFREEFLHPGSSCEPSSPKIEAIYLRAHIRNPGASIAWEACIVQDALLAQSTYVPPPDLLLSLLPHATDPGASPPASWTPLRKNKGGAGPHSVPHQGYAVAGSSVKAKVWGCLPETFTRFGFPVEPITDNATYFTSKRSNAKSAGDLRRTLTDSAQQARQHLDVSRMDHADKRRQRAFPALPQEVLHHP
ncbi:hypothetical protein HPB50_027389 [Hyalomma asiaticum]|uniref:Uncharacterized protein n=1 Tax=Hyalomma asiaticum TaxID=266040 RepID=A0ACB7TRV0_HYAAI|nr:hypothetical protein HPB50_027389 [Hyalomma asiaticum]